MPADLPDPPFRSVVQKQVNEGNTGKERDKFESELENPSNPLYLKYGV
jgi:hypothetical protein